MGGNAFKELGTIRMGKPLYTKVVEKVVTRLSPHMDKIEVIPSYTTKQSFGDIDFISTHTLSVEELHNHLSAPASMKNGNVTSLVIEVDSSIVQVDIINTSSEHYNFAKSYYSYNDFGMLVGRLPAPYLKVGWQGLYYKYRGKDILITLDWSTALTILDIDYTEWEKGIDDISHAYKIISASKYFSPKYYSNESLNNKNRVRNKKRQGWMTFTEMAIEDTLHYESVSSIECAQQCLITYPHIISTMREIDQEQDRKNLLKTKFNGNIVRDLLGIEGKELGAIMMYLKPHLSEEFLLSANELKIRNTIFALYHSYLEADHE